MLKLKCRSFWVNQYDGDIHKTAVDGKQWKLMEGFDFHADNSDGVRRLFWWSPRFDGQLKICIARQWQDAPPDSIPIWLIARLEAAFQNRHKTKPPRRPRKMKALSP